MSYKYIYINNYKYTRETHIFTYRSHFAIPPLCFIFLLNVVFSFTRHDDAKKRINRDDDDDKYLII